MMMMTMMMMMKTTMVMILISSCDDENVTLKMRIGMRIMPFDISQHFQLASVVLGEFVGFKRDFGGISDFQQIYFSFSNMNFFRII